LFQLQFVTHGRPEGGNMLSKRKVLSSMVVIGLAIPMAGAATPQSYPDRLIKLVVPVPPGAGTDVMARLMAERLSSSLRQPVIVENIAGGAGGTIGARAVARANPDGHTLLFTAPGPLVTAPAIYKNIDYDPVKSFAPVGMIMSSPQLLVVHPAVPVRSVHELIAYAKANPGKISFASGGFGTQPHLLGEMFRLTNGIDIVHVPHRGTASAVTNVLAGQVQMYFENFTALLSHVEDGKLRALAVADETRSSQLPDVPTTTESGFPLLQGTYWAGIVAPAGTSASIVDKLNAAINEILKSKELEVHLAKLSAKPKIGSPRDFAIFMAAETRKWTEVIDAAGIKAD
jgi:tripartite-type tricarboxylate transporter receptor subunit TctC